MFPELLGGIMGAGLGSFLGGKGSKQPDIGEQITELVNRMNDNLNQYLEKAMGYTTKQTDKAIAQQGISKKAANDYLIQYLQKAQQQAQQNAWMGQQQQRAFLSPMMMAGNSALDSYMDSLGLSRPTVGYGAIQNSLLANADQNYLKQMLGPAPQVGNAVDDPGKSPSPLTMTMNEKIKAINAAPGGFLGWASQQFGSGVAGDMAGGLRGSPKNGDFYNLVNQWADNNIIKPKNQAAMDQYNQQKAAYEQYQQQLAASNAYNQQLSSIYSQGPNAQQQGILAALQNGMIR